MMPAPRAFHRWLAWPLLLGVLALAGTPARAEDPQRASDAARPVPRKDRRWMKRHESLVERAKKGAVDILFLGDSITHGWESNGKEIWQQRFEPLKAANFGIGGDRTQHVLWRITEGKELEGIHPKILVLMIGTNNMGGTNPLRAGRLRGGNSPQEIADGIAAIVRAVREQRPETRVLLLAIFPRGEKPDTEARTKIKAVNRRIAKLEDGQHVRYLDIGPLFLDPEGNLKADIVYDYLHLTRKGYEIWADAIQPVLDELLRKS
jgi:lysophospholipase L1-like esterase